jgi:hypothetical protein
MDEPEAGTLHTSEGSGRDDLGGEALELRPPCDAHGCVDVARGTKRWVADRPVERDLAGVGADQHDVVTRCGDDRLQIADRDEGVRRHREDGAG